MKSHSLKIISKRCSVLFQIVLLSSPTEERGAASQEAPILGRTEQSCQDYRPSSASAPAEHLTRQPQKQASTPSSHPDNLRSRQQPPATPSQPACVPTVWLTHNTGYSPSENHRPAFLQAKWLLPGAPHAPLSRTGATGHEGFRRLLLAHHEIELCFTSVPASV